MISSSLCRRLSVVSRQLSQHVTKKSCRRGTTISLHQRRTAGGMNAAAVRCLSGSGSQGGGGAGGGAGGGDPPYIPGLRNQYGSLGEAPSPYSGKPAAAWQAAENVDVQRVTQKAIIYEMIHRQTKTIESVVPWFLDNMPSSYFRQVPERFRFDHMKALAAVKDADMDLYLNLSSHLADGRQILTFIRPGTAPGTLLRMVEELPFKYSTDEPLSRLHVFSTADESMSLNMFVYGHRPNEIQSVDVLADTASPILHHAEQIQSGAVPGEEPNGLVPADWLERDALLDYLSQCTETYIRIGLENPSRFLKQRELVQQVSGSEGTRVYVCEAVEETPYHHHHDPDQKYYWVNYVVANSLPQVALENLCRVLYHYRFDVARSRLDVVPDGDNGSVTILRALVSPTEPLKQDTFQRLEAGLIRSKWLDPVCRDLVFGGDFSWLGVRRGEIITAMLSLVHPVLAKSHPVAFSKANIFDTVLRERFLSHAAAVADLFLDRFRPGNPLSDEDLESRGADILAAIDSDVEDYVATEVLKKMVDVVKKTLKTNAYMPDRYALGFRLDPAVMVPTGETDQSHEKTALPYGVLFVHGRRFNAYHVRFRDIARGGMRLVTPASPELYALESARHYDECYGLAYAQQLKNKDIPEGGSKAVNLINTDGLDEQGKFFVMRKSVKAFADAVLDLIVDTAETREFVVDMVGKKEVLYLGPDEQVIPADIEWIVERAAKRGYDTPAAFMSSKPKSGINHKEFGVTSESVNAYLDVALRRTLNIDPAADSFSVKLTGGPDGDVAGNEMKILFREYGDNVKIVGVADHSGCAEDQEAGLNHEELLRLVKEGLDISHFDTDKLGPTGALHTVDTADGVKMRNTMHNRLRADAFLPCGGRPNTIDTTNYKQFLLEDGVTPSSPLIVEGANLFVTAAARDLLSEEAGVVIVKDSSANKGGVITSSFEICAAMLLTEQEFYQHKEQIVSEVIDKLRQLAELEAKLLFREYENYGGHLHNVSKIISDSVNAVTDALNAALAEQTPEQRERLLPLFRQHLPKTIADLAFDERVHDRVPDQYVQNAISSSLASKIVYKEGTKFVSAQSPNKLAQIALTYLEKEGQVAALMESLNQSEDLSEEDKDAIMKLLDAGGARTALEVY